MLYLQPQFRSTSGEILNVVSQDGKMLGYLMYIYKEDDDLYVLGHLDDVGEKQNYIDVIGKYVSGLKDVCGVKKDPYVRIHCGGDPIQLSKKEDESS
jgi:hypothetical protein